MRSLIIALAAALALGGGAALAQTSSPEPLALVHIKNFAYVPEAITIRAGQNVRFVEDDATPHTVTAVDKSFDSGNLDQHATWTHAFAKEGTYAYFCAYHPYMKGSVTVKAP